jgi:RNA polymerase sigma-70 factor (ECF subfamily)
MPDLRDPIQFNDAYRRLAPIALASAKRVLRDEAAAEDVVQDVFMQLWLKPSLYDPARGSLNSYVPMLARSRALDRWRTRGRGTPPSTVPPSRNACSRSPPSRPPSR